MENYSYQWKDDWAGITYIVHGTRSFSGKLREAIRCINHALRKVELNSMHYDARGAMYYGIILVNGVVPITYVVTRAEDGSYNVMYGEELVYIKAAESIPGDIKAAEFADAIVKVVVSDAKAISRGGMYDASK